MHEKNKIIIHLNFSIMATLGRGESGRCREVAVSGGSTVLKSFKPQYPHTNSPNWSLYISLKNELREFDKRSKYFLLGDHFPNSHNLISLLGLKELIVRHEIATTTLKWGAHL